MTRHTCKPGLRNEDTNALVRMSCRNRLARSRKHIARISTGKREIEGESPVICNERKTRSLVSRSESRDREKNRSFTPVDCACLQRREWSSFAERLKSIERSAYQQSVSSAPYGELMLMRHYENVFDHY